MALKEIQKKIDKWVSQYTTGYWAPLEMLARLTEETGELARELNHRYGPKKKKESEENKEIADEIADIIFTIGCIANSLNLDLDKAFQRVMDKLNNRDKNRWKRK